jgi:hypothetical protein
VADDGPGVADVAFDKMFEPFFTTKTVGEGAGLGPWISYAIARERGGAVFVLRLPVVNRRPFPVVMGQDGIRWRSRRSARSMLQDQKRFRVIDRRLSPAERGPLRAVRHCLGIRGMCG